MSLLNKEHTIICRWETQCGIKLSNGRLIITFINYNADTYKLKPITRFSLALLSKSHSKPNSIWSRVVWAQNINLQPNNVAYLLNLVIKFPSYQKHVQAHVSRNDRKLLGLHPLSLSLPNEAAKTFEGKNKVPKKAKKKNVGLRKLPLSSQDGRRRFF